MSDLYDMLGVAKDATPDQIKKGYRLAIRQAHPDRGGDPDKAAQLNEAYATLGDPERRAKYDATGDGSEDGALLAAAMELLAFVLQRAMDKDADDIVDAARGELAKLKEVTTRQKVDAAVQRGRWAKKRSKIKVRDGQVNLAHQVIDGKVQEASKKLAQADRALLECAEAMRLLEEYESVGVAPPAPPVPTGVYLDAGLLSLFMNAGRG